MASTRGRQVVVPLANKSGGSVAAGDVVILDSANDTAFTTTTTARYEGGIGIAQETIANNGTGRVLVAGYAALVNVPASVTRGHYVETHTVAKQATGNSSRRSGSFGVFLTGGATPTAALFGSMPDQTLSAAGQVSTLNFVIDGGGATITTGIKGDLVVDFACTITGVTLLADQSGSIVVDIWRDSYANFPPLVADSITAAAKPTISTATKSQDLTLTGWTTSLSAGDILRFNVDSVTTLTRVTCALRVARV